MGRLSYHYERVISTALDDVHATNVAGSYDDLWKVERKLYHAFLNINTAQVYVPYQVSPLEI